MKSSNRPIYITIIVALAAVILIAGCETTPKYKAGGPYYYDRADEGKLPALPRDEITKDEADARKNDGKTFYEAYFNDDLTLKTIVKYTGVLIVLRQDYFYKDKKLRRVRITDEEGRITIRQYDEKGKMIREIKR